MEKDKIVAIIQTRMGSSRLPGKVLLKICNKPMLTLMLERLKKSKKIDEIIVATTTKSEDDIIEKLATSNGFQVFRGSELDCLDRYYQTAKRFSAKYVLKLTSDCPLIDPVVVDNVIEYFLKDSDHFDYVSNVRPPTFPDGLDVEMFTFKALERAWKEAKDPYQREHTTTYIHLQPEKFMIGNVNNKDGENLFLSQRWTVDYPEDFNFVKSIYENLYDNGKIFLMSEILEFLKSRKDIMKINEHLIPKNKVH